jgi:hypothetical protein
MAADSPSNAKPAGCTHVVLARGVVAEVEYCTACRIFHVNIDSVSLRFRATALRDVRDTLAAALAAHERALRERDDAAAAAVPMASFH